MPTPDDRGRSAALLVTGAWNPTVDEDAAARAARRTRLLESARFYANSGRFDRIVLADGTMTVDDRRAVAAELPGVELPELATAASGRHSGPSYLEALLYGEVLSSGVLGDDDALWAKATGGYRITNLGAVLDAARGGGLCWLHQHPLRPWARSALSGFYLLDRPTMAAWLGEAAGQAEALRSSTLEAALLRFVRARGPRRIRAPYPSIHAYFATAGYDSGSPGYRVNDAAWRLLSAAGLYALQLPPG